MRVLLAGGTGFLGRYVALALRDAGHVVRTLSRREAGGDHVPCDLTRGPPPEGALSGCDAVVNLVGIKAGSAEAFARAHVGVVRHLVAAAREAGVKRLLHVSVVDIAGSETAYARTKREGEAVVHASGLAATILRPALVVGPGDDALSTTIRMVRLGPLVVVPRPAPGRLAVVDVRDVATAVVSALERPITVGRTYDVVGPEGLTMADLVGRVAEALHLPTRCLTVPAALLRPAAAVIERLGPLAILTRSQLDMLVRGLDGNGTAAARDLDLQARPLLVERIQAIAEGVGGPSLRIVTGPEAHRWLARARPALPSLSWLLPVALASMLALPFVWPDIWTRMLVIVSSLGALVALRSPLQLRALARPTLEAIAWGLGAAALMVGAGLLVVLGLQALAPGLVAGTGAVLGFTDAWPLAIQLPLLAAIATGEDVVWRAAVGLPLCARLGPVVGSLLAGAAFALAHVTTGPPILWVAALLAGAAWTALLVRTRSLVAVVVCHVAWDLAMVAALPWVTRGPLV